MFIEYLYIGFTDCRCIYSVYDWDKSGNDDLIGSVETNLNELREKPKDMILRRKAKPQKAYGSVSVGQFSATPLASFLDYMQGGAEISLLAAIDVECGDYHTICYSLCSLHIILYRVSPCSPSISVMNQYTVYRIKWSSQRCPESA